MLATLFLSLLEKVFDNFSVHLHDHQAYIARKVDEIEQQVAPQAQRANGSIIAAIDAGLHRWYEFCGKGDEYIAENDVGDAVGLFYNFCDDS